MTNFLLKDPDCVFIHIHKTGGTSIRRGVWRGRQHAQQAGFIPEAWDGHFRFAFVRDPLGRFLSVYRMFTEGTRNYGGGVLVQSPRPMPLGDFLDIVRDEGVPYDGPRRTMEERIRHHAIPQTHPYNCLREADFIGRYEALPEDFARIARHLGIPPRLPRMNVTRPARAAPEPVPPAIADAVRRFYAEDYRFLEDEIGHYRSLG